MTKEELKKYLDKIYEEAKLAFQENEIPVACALIFPDGKTYYSHNHVEKENNPFSHAEFSLLCQVQKETGLRYFKDAVLIVNLEPCLLCMGAILKLGISKLYYVLDDKKGGALSHYHAFVDDKIEVIPLQDSRFDQLMNDFFKNLRDSEKKKC